MLKEFATFIAVARDGTFTGAGQRLVPYEGVQLLRDVESVGLQVIRHSGHAPFSCCGALRVSLRVSQQFRNAEIKYQ